MLGAGTFIGILITGDYFASGAIRTIPSAGPILDYIYSTGNYILSYFYSTPKSGGPQSPSSDIILNYPAPPLSSP